MTTRCVALLILCVFSFVAYAAETARRAWQWADIDRLRARYDTSLAAERRAAANCDPNCRGMFIVDGKRHPELLMPAELMDTLSGAFDASDAEVRNRARELWLRRVADLELPRSFWEDLYDAGREFFDAWARYHALGEPRPEAGPSEAERFAAERQMLYDSICAKRARALRAARDRFGNDTFDQFLYRAVAPGVLVTEGSSRSTDALWIEGGCE